jgi:TatD DNase family protein
MAQRSGVLPGHYHLAVMRLIDSHGHLQAPAFRDDVEAVLVAAYEAGVERLLAPGWDAATSVDSLALAERYPGIDASAGIHPHLAAAADDTARATIERLAAEPRVVAIGETGLDYDRDFSPRTMQLTNLRWHLELAQRVGKPLILHCRSRPLERDAQDDLMRELRSAAAGAGEWAARLASRPVAVLHSFSGPVDYAEAALALGCAVSVSGLVFRRGEEASAEVARLVPADRLLVETDSPYLAPPGAPRRRNEPRWVAVTAAWLAEQRRVDPSALGDDLVAAYDRTFGRADPAAAAPATTRAATAAHAEVTTRDRA